MFQWLCIRLTDLATSVLQFLTCALPQQRVTSRLYPTPANFQNMPAPATSAVTTRLATLGDVERLHQVIQLAYRSDKNWTNESELVQGERITTDELAEQIRVQVNPIVVAEIDGCVAGCIQIECTSPTTWDLP